MLYMITFIDDFTRKIWIYFLAKKSEVLPVFKFFKKFMEKESGENIVCLYIDRGGEFTSKEFSNFCNENEIKQ